MECYLAEGQGFEPWVGVSPQRFSRPSRSAAPASLHFARDTFIFSGRQVDRLHNVDIRFHLLYRSYEETIQGEH